MAAQRILVVDDNAALSQMYTTYLEGKGYEVKGIRDPQIAVETAVTFKPDLILLDVMMPQISGLEVLQAMRKTEATKTTPIVLLTAVGDKTIKEKAALEGANAYLEKSETDLSALLDAVRANV